jgi:hypothetical protein
MAAQPTDLPDEAYGQLKTLCLSLAAIRPGNRNVPRAIVSPDEERGRAVRAAMERGWGSVQTPAGLAGGLWVTMSYGWSDTSLRLARRTARAAADDAFAPDKQALNSRGQPLPAPGGEAAFLAAHALLLWGNEADVPLAANLLDEKYQQRALFGEGKYGVAYFEVRDMALMAIARLRKADPAQLGMQASKRKIRCPIAGAVRMFEGDGADWGKWVKQFSRAPADEAGKGASQD